MIAVVLAAIGAGVGAALPKVIAAIPDREPDDGKERTPYRVLAAAPQLGLWLALATAVAWGAMGAALGATAQVAAYLAVAALGVAMAYVDLREHRLPDWLTYPAFGAAAVLLAVAAAVTGDWGDYGRAWLAAIVLTAGYLILALIRPGDLGLGDVKLAASIGMVLGWLGWDHVILGTFAGFLLAGLVAAALLISRRAGRRTAIPFGPFVLAGALIAVIWGAPIVDAYLGR